jgi:IclR family acetate operon transcriptional repressor
LPVDEGRSLLSEPIERMTEATTVDPAEVERELQVARAQGYAVSRGQRTKGIYAIAAPVFDHTQKVIGAVGISAPDLRMTEEIAERMGTRVREVAWELSTTLGATEEGVRAVVADLRLG